MQHHRRPVGLNSGTDLDLEYKENLERIAGRPLTKTELLVLADDLHQLTEIGIARERVTDRTDELLGHHDTLRRSCSR